jgi:hypothetical protein
MLIMNHGDTESRRRNHKYLRVSVPPPFDFAQGAPSNIEWAWFVER